MLTGLALTPSPRYRKLVVHPYLHQYPGEVLQQTLFWNNAQCGQADQMWESSLVTISMAQFDLLVIKRKRVGNYRAKGLFLVSSLL